MKLRQTLKTELIRYKQEILPRAVIKTADRGSTMKNNRPVRFSGGLAFQKGYR